ncbi:MAG: hypothetical protein E3J54_03200 [Actinobacteria bacterium]|nr:MAG: hypothetical protein E3J54_03200 [Actinomycetota bacterium]
MRASEILMQEHRNISRLIEVLKNASKKLIKGESIDPQIFIKGGSFITQYMEQKHHGKEEKMFDAMMNDYGFEKDKEPLRTFLIEHDQARSYTRALRQAAYQLDHKDNKSKEAVLHQASSYILLLTHHIRNEDNNLFPLADSKFSQETNKELLKQFIEFDKNFPEKPLLEKLYQLEDLV